MSVNVVWFRRDLRLSDNPALYSATLDGRPIIPLFILDEHTHNAGAAFKWRLGLSIKSLSLDLEKHNSKLILRKGNPLYVLKELRSSIGDFNIFGIGFMMKIRLKEILKSNPILRHKELR